MNLRALARHAASREAESHRYALGDDLIEFKLTVKPRGHVQVELKEPH